jgi:AcrB/AcrD/AcrF family protein/RAD3-like DEAD/DEAH box helicase
MDVFALDRSVVGDYSTFARSFTSMKSEGLRRGIDDTYKPGRFWPEPLLQLNPHYKAGDSVLDLVRDGTLDTGCAAYFRDFQAGEGDSDRSLKLRRHQREAIVKSAAGKSFVVTTGTGSGKSLCFFIPIADSVIRARRAGEALRTRAIVIYPMNALANSQMKELEKFLAPVDGSSSVCAAAISEVSSSKRRRSSPKMNITYYRELRTQGLAVAEAVFRGAEQRMRPLLMTALSAAVGLFPAAISHGIGSQVQRPLATVVVQAPLLPAHWRASGAGAMSSASNVPQAKAVAPGVSAGFHARGAIVPSASVRPRAFPLLS